MRTPRAERSASRSISGEAQWWARLGRAALSDVRSWLAAQMPLADKVEDDERYLHVPVPQAIYPKRRSGENGSGSNRARRQVPLVVAGRRVSGVAALAFALLLLLLVRLLTS